MTDFNRYKVFTTFVLITVAFLIFIATLLYISVSDRKLPRTIKKDKTIALRGKIYSKNNFALTYSKKLYSAMVDTRNIDPNKKEVFIKLFSIYSGLSEKLIKKRLSLKKGNVFISRKINTATAKYLKDLARKLYRLGVFKNYTLKYKSKDGKTEETTFLHGLDIIENREFRVYPYGDLLQPVLGYTKNIFKTNFTQIKGLKGLEKVYDKALKANKNGLIIGRKDVVGQIVLDKKTYFKKAQNGYNIHLNIDLKVQKLVEKILDKYEKSLEAREIVAAVMDSYTGKIVTIASSNRFDKKRIRQDEISHLNATVTEFVYEPGSVLKPVTFAMLLMKNRVNPLEILRTYGGRYKLGNRTITDTHQNEWISASNAIVYSSNIAIAQLAQRLSGVEFYTGLKKFGFGLKSGIDLPYEHKGFMPTIRQLNNKIYKATVGYGYGISTTFIQVFKVYSSFNNHGYLVTPKITSFMNTKENLYKLDKIEAVKVMPSFVANKIKEILIKTVNAGTGKAAIIDGLEIGGKTGTSHIPQKGIYVNLYNSSFFGFANDKKNRYTIGVLVREPKAYMKYFASKSAVLVFKEIVQTLLNEKYLRI